MVAETEKPLEPYKLTSGKYSGPDPNADPESPQFKLRHYNPGETVYSTEDLVSKFVNKFEKLTPGVNAPVQVSEERRQMVSDMVQSGVWEEADRKFLEELPEENFQKVNRLSVAQSGQVGQTKEETTAGTGTQENVLGEDVTADFPKAKPGKLKVFRNAAGKHQIAKAQAPDKPINKEALDVEGVEEWLEQNVKGR